MTSTTFAAFAATLDTPAVVIDLDIAQRNIARLEQACRAAGVGNRPHIKTHKSIEMARLQLQAGAVGITCQKLGEAEAMADGGVNDILISYNVLGAAKHPRLRALAARVQLTVCCDSRTVADGYATAMGGHSRPLSVLVECDTGRHRCGVVSPEEAVALARHIAGHPALRFEGFLLYPPDGKLDATRAWLEQARAGCERVGLPVRTVSSGGTPHWRQVGQIGETEYRAGTYIYNDRQMVRMQAATLDDCALTVHATMVSHPEPTRVMLDAGSKTLSADLVGFDDHGWLPDYPKARIYKLAEEHAFVDVSACSQVPRIGEVVRILPNHVCPVSNLFDSVLTVRGGQAHGRLAIAARGKVT